MDRVRLLAIGAGMAESMRPGLVPRGTRHQVLVTAACTATLGLAAGAASRWSDRVPRWLVPVALGVTVVRAGRLRSAQRTSYPDWDPRPLRPVLATVTGGAAGVALTAAAGAAPRVVGGAGTRLAGRCGGSPSWWGVAAAGAGIAASTVAGMLAGRHVLRGLRDVGTRADPALVNAPDDPFVSGGPGSLVAYDTLARDGRRFVSFRTPTDQIPAVAAEPLRVYVGLHSAESVAGRVDLAMAELERLGAFERSTLLLMSPAGSGYADYVAAEAVECVTRGDCATVVVQYGVLPSMLSLPRVGLGARTFRCLLDRVTEQVRTMDEPPRIVVYGESLGAKTAQEALLMEPSLVEAEGRVAGVDLVVSVGTPGGRSLRDDTLDDPRVVHIDRWQQLSGSQRATLWFLDHDADPVARWAPSLAWTRPDWLRRPHGRNVPDRMGWLPLLTWWQVLFDVVFAAQQQSGVFHSVGHDYRADLPQVLAAAIGRTVDVDVVGELLARREVERDRLLELPTARSLPH